MSLYGIFKYISRMFDTVLEIDISKFKCLLMLTENWLKLILSGFIFFFSPFDGKENLRYAYFKEEKFGNGVFIVEIMMLEYRYNEFT